MTEIEQIERGIATLESQRAILGDVVVEAALAPLRERLLVLQAGGARHGRRRQIAVLFGDVSGYTTLASKMDIEDVAGMLNKLWSMLDDAIRAHGGRIDKHIGDAVMAVWGIESAREDNAAQAIHAALAMHNYLQHTEVVPGVAPLHMRIGIHSGPALLGVIDSTGEFTATGDTVNVAERLESIAPVGGIVISHEVYRQVRGLFTVTPLGSVVLKGKKEPQYVYQVMNAKARSFHLNVRGVEGVETRMIGRDLELARLQTAVESVLATGKMGVVAILGEAGAGKSRLLHEFLNWLELLPKTFWAFKGRADESSQHQPHGLWRHLLSHRFSIADDDPLAVARQKLVEGVKGVLAGDVRAEVKAHFIGHLVGFDFSNSPWLRGALGDAGQFYEQAVMHLGEMLAAAAANSPVLLALEDLHWMDEASYRTLAHVLRKGRDLQIVVTLTARHTLVERWPDWETALGPHERVDLAPLSPEDCSLLIDDIFQKARLIPAALRDLIVTRSEGNPFFLEEMVKMLIDQEVIVPGDDEWFVSPAPVAADQVPSTLVGVLQARLDGLQEDERRVLQQASVMGRVFWDEALAQFGQEDGLAGGPEELVTRTLAQLRHREMVYTRDDSTFPVAKEYSFKHALLRDVTYETVLKPHRRRYHALAAGWLIDRSGERAAEFAGVIADHFQQAGQSETAATWYATAGDRARATYAPAAAIHFYEQALALAPARLEWLDGLAEALWHRADYGRSAEVYHQMLAGAQAAGDGLAQARALNGLSLVHERQHEVQASFSCAAQAAEIARTAGSSAQTHLAEALFLQGWSLYRQNRHAEAVALAEQSLALCTTADDLDAVDSHRIQAKLARVQALNLSLLGSVHSRLGSFEKANSFSEQAYELYMTLGDRRGAITVLNNLAVAAHLSGHYAGAAAGYRRVLELCQETGNQDLAFGVTGNLAEALVDLQDYAGAETMLLELAHHEQGGVRVGLVKVHRYLAEAQWGLGRSDEVWATALAGLEHAGSEPSDYLAGLWRVIGLLAANAAPPATVYLPASEDWTADACFGRALELAIQTGNEIERAHILRDWGRSLIARGDDAQGRALWQEALARFAAAGLQVQVERMDRVLPELSQQTSAGESAPTPANRPNLI